MPTNCVTLLRVSTERRITAEDRAGRVKAQANGMMNIREVRLAAGAEFIVMIFGDIMTMPGLPKIPSAEKIDLVDGKVVGLF